METKKDIQRDHKFLFFENTQVLSRDGYKYFKENKKFKSPHFNEFKFWRTIAKSLLFIMNELYRNTNGGLYLEDLGYFIYLPKYVVKGRRISVVRKKPNKYHYEKCFIPLCDELLSYRTEGWMRTEEKVIPKMRNIKFQEELKENEKYLRGYYNVHEKTKYKQI